MVRNGTRARQANILAAWASLHVAAWSLFWTWIGAK